MPPATGRMAAGRMAAGHMATGRMAAWPPAAWPPPTGASNMHAAGGRMTRSAGIKSIDNLTN